MGGSMNSRTLRVHDCRTPASVLRRIVGVENGYSEALLGEFVRRQYSQGGPSLVLEGLTLSPKLRELPQVLTGWGVPVTVRWGKKVRTWSRLREPVLELLANGNWHPMREIRHELKESGRTTSYSTLSRLILKLVEEGAIERRHHVGGNGGSRSWVRLAEKGGQ